MGDVVSGERGKTLAAECLGWCDIAAQHRARRAEGGWWTVKAMVSPCLESFTPVQ